MSHIHIPDGVLPLWLVLVGWLLTAAVVTIAVKTLADADARKRVPLVGAIGALMLVAMSSEVVPIAYHINLTVVAGILLGPAMSVLTALVVVTLLALLGHGGVTVIGLNVIIIATEMVLGGMLFGLLVRRFGPKHSAWSSAAATVLTLMVTTTMLIGVVALGGSLAATRESGAFDPQELRFENPFAEGIFGSELIEEEEQPAEEERRPLALGRFALMVYGLGALGWLIEAFVTAGIVGFIARVRPSLVLHGVQLSDSRRRIGDEGVHH
jgi:cobalt/nickel transport system permease protein